MCCAFLSSSAQLSICCALDVDLICGGLFVTTSPTNNPQCLTAKIFVWQLIQSGLHDCDNTPSSFAGQMSPNATKPAYCSSMFLLATGKLSSVFDHDSSIFFFFFFQLASELAERNLTKTSHMLRSECNLNVCLKSGVSRPATNRDDQITFFPQFWYLTETFNGLYLRNETRYT